MTIAERLRTVLSIPVIVHVPSIDGAISNFLRSADLRMLHLQNAVVILFQRTQVDEQSYDFCFQLVHSYPFFALVCVLTLGSRLRATKLLEADQLSLDIAIFIY